METIHAISTNVETTSALLSFAEDKLQLIALSFMAIVYFFKVRWILSFKAGKERQAPTGNRDTTAKRGAVYSLFNIFMPWSMPSTRQHPFFYLQFGIFHVAVATSITMSIVLPYLPQLISSLLIIAALQTLFALGFLVGVGRLIRRIVSPYIRAISTPDDYFSLALLVVWLAFAFKATPNNRDVTEFWLLGYFFLTAFFLFYVPFSKISHYIFYPFTRWYLGKTLGHRGVYPLPFNPGNEPMGRMFTRIKSVEGK
jgi:hypothetical protein